MLSTCILLSSFAFAGAEASNFRPENRDGANKWNANSAIDGNPKTAWMLPGDSEGKGEWIMIDGPDTISEALQISMLVGFNLNDETFIDYARVKSIKVEVYEYNNSMDLVATGRSKTVEFEDKMELQTRDLGVGVESERGGKYKITVNEIYPGKDFPALAVSEVLLHLKDFDVIPKIIDTTGGADGADPLKLLDDSTKSFWSGAADASITYEGLGGASISRMALIPGPKSYARPKKIKITTAGQSLEHTLPDSTKPNWVLVPTTTGYTGSTWDSIQVQILEVYPGSSSEQVAISELDIRASSMSGL